MFWSKETIPEIRTRKRDRECKISCKTAPSAQPQTGNRKSFEKFQGNHYGYRLNSIKLEYLWCIVTVLQIHPLQGLANINTKTGS